MLQKIAIEEHTKLKRGCLDQNEKAIENCRKFNETCAEGYTFLLNILIDDAHRQDDEAAFKKL